MKINSIRFKTSVLFSSILCVILLINGLVIYFGLQRILYRNLDNELKIKVERMSSIVNAYAEMQESNRDFLPFMQSFIMRRLDASPIIEEIWKSDVKMLNLRDDYFRIVNPQGQVVFSSPNLTKEINALLSREIFASSAEAGFKTIKHKVVSGRLINKSFLYRKRIPMIIQLLTPTTPLNKILNELTFFVLLSIAAIILFTSFLGIYLTRTILKPVSSVTATADKISHTDLSFRIDEKEVDWEMRDLIHSFNLMISRLEAAFAHINEFSSHVAHELKTPLAIIRGEIELALSEEARDKEEYREVLEATLEETDRLIRIIKDLLLLAKLDYRPEIFKFEKLELLSLIKDLFSQVEILASEKHIQMILRPFDGEIMVEADPVHLRRLFLNLINNAIKFTPVEGRVDISVEKRAKNVVVKVKDSGPGILASDLDKIFTKFYRVRQESGEVSGNGLGLPIARSIAKAHKGDISVQSQPNKGSLFIATLPCIS